MSRSTSFKTYLAAGLLFAGAAATQAADLPDTSQSTTLTATVSEQAELTVPAGVNFAVSDVSGATVASAASVSASNIVLASATKQLKISLQANAALFTPPVALATTWSAGDVSWNQSTWTAALGASGTLSESSFLEVGTCTADAASCSTSDLVFTLGANSAVKRSGDHTLAVTWKIESIGS